VRIIVVVVVVSFIISIATLLTCLLTYLPLDYTQNVAILVHIMYREAGRQIWVHIFGGPHPRNLLGKKTCKILHDFGQL